MKRRSSNQDPSEPDLESCNAFLVEIYRQITTEMSIQGHKHDLRCAALLIRVAAKHLSTYLGTNALAAHREQFGDFTLLV